MSDHALPPLSQSSSDEVEQARARKAELIEQVRTGHDYWTPKSGWADRFTDDEIWAAWRRVAKAPALTACSEVVAATLVGDVIDRKHR